MLKMYNNSAYISSLILRIYTVFRFFCLWKGIFEGVGLKITNYNNRVVSIVGHPLLQTSFQKVFKKKPVSTLFSIVLFCFIYFRWSSCPSLPTAIIGRRKTGTALPQIRKRCPTGTVRGQSLDTRDFVNLCDLSNFIWKYDYDSWY